MMLSFLRVLDRLLGILCFGDGEEDVTISTRAAMARTQGKRWGCWLCRMLDGINPGHCDQAIKTDRQEAEAVIEETQKP